MTQEEKYNLKFEIINQVPFSTRCFCYAKGNSQTTIFLSDLLSTLGNRSGEFLLDEINSAINGQDYEDTFTPDGALFNNGVEIIPPIVIIYMQFEFPLIELKLLLDEWVLFCNANS